jgi:hypothetical protein
MCLYLLLNYGVYAVIVSLILDSWKRDGGVLIESNQEKWIIYVHGIPVRESRSSLRNLLFASEHTMRRRYLALLVPKLLLALACIYSLATAILTAPVGYAQSLATGTLLFLLYAVLRTSRSIRVAYLGTWLTTQHDLGSKAFHAAYAPAGEGLCVPFLGCVFD